MASGSGVSAAGALTSVPDSNRNARTILDSSMMAPFTDGLRHLLGQAFGDLVEETGSGEPALVGADQERQILGHVAGFDGADADLLQRGRELRQWLVVVEL